MFAVPEMLVAANSDHEPTTVTFAAAWITTSAPAIAAATARRAALVRRARPERDWRASVRRMEQQPRPLAAFRSVRHRPRPHGRRRGPIRRRVRSQRA